jgi:ubiquinone/menaquinone biosynthesis C-methylase UbiE
MDSAEEARDYDAMDHSGVNRAFVADFLAFFAPVPGQIVLDVGTGTAQIPIELCRQDPVVNVVGVDLAEHMLRVAKENVERAGLANRIRLERGDAKRPPGAAGRFAAVISNSIVHHIPEPASVLAEMVRMVAPRGALFVRDLLRPDTDAEVKRLVHTYAGDANAHQQKMFDDSLRAALTLAEIRELVRPLGFDPATVQQTTDRHWTWTTRKA